MKAKHFTRCVLWQRHTCSVGIVLLFLLLNHYNSLLAQTNPTAFLGVADSLRNLNLVHKIENLIELEHSDLSEGLELPVDLHEVNFFQKLGGWNVLNYFSDAQTDGFDIARTGTGTCKMLIDAVKAQDEAKVQELLVLTDPNCKLKYSEPEVLRLRGEEHKIMGATTPLVAAARNGNLEIATLLLEADAKVEFFGSEELTPLMEASVYGNTAIVELLLANGAAIDRKFRGEGTALLIAARAGQTETVKLLHAKGADIHKSHGDGTPLLNAARNGHIEAVKILVNLGVNVDAISPGEGTALINAVRDENYDMTKTLLDLGADPNRSVSGEENPMYWAKATKNKRLQKLLKNYQ